MTKMIRKDKVEQGMYLKRPLNALRSVMGVGEGETSDDAEGAALSSDDNPVDSMETGYLGSACTSRERMLPLRGGWKPWVIFGCIVISFYSYWYWTLAVP